MNLPGYYVHALRSNPKGTYSVRVTENLRLPFAFDAEGAKNIDLEDYH